jgi:protein-tyrosine kinase
MSRLFEALKRMEAERGSPPEVVGEAARTIEFLTEAPSERVAAKEPPPREIESPKLEISPAPRLVALTDGQSFGAEKFRALAARLESLRKERELRSLQVTSSIVGEGKTLVAANLAATLATHLDARVLLVEGDLHRPALSPLFGVPPVRGLSHWWSAEDRELSPYVHKLADLSLWFLSAGKACDKPSKILQSPRFATAYAQLIAGFDWIVVDSAPMLPMVTANLWSRFVDGTLLVVREGLAPLKELKKGLDALDNPELIGAVLNEASEVSRANYSYYGSPMEGEDSP